MAAKGLEKDIGKKENFAQIGVYFQSLNTKLIYEEPKYEVTNLIRPARISLFNVYPSN